ncbi:MAG: OprO/OprP family phosphate-selective porin [Gammaproteobacteria bacterium]|nr:OprO/OprP family phosphate-selective porin [Gammaproteobacteria bacterium]MDH5591332.1 OprO/OprP family phosphate-selective porin [Gammaproteobacteria bacterium]
MKLKTSSLLIAGALFGAAVMPAQANNEAMMNLLKVLRDQGTITAESYELLINAAKADKEATETTTAEVKAEVNQATADMPKITTKGKLKIEDREGNWSFQTDGRVMWDAINVDNDGLRTDDDGEGTELRRGRLGFVGSIYDFTYKLDIGFATGDTVIKDAYVGYKTKFGDNPFILKLGQTAMPFSFNTVASSKYMGFLDRPMYSDSAISRTRGSGAYVQLAEKDYRWILMSSLTNGILNNGKTTGSDETTFAVRGSFVPLMQDKTHLLQVGIGYLTQGSGGDNKFKYDQRLVSHMAATKDLKAELTSGYDGSNAYNIDMFGVYGPFHLLAEYTDWTADQSGADDLDLSGYSVEAGYFLTGESMKWKQGYTSDVTPKSNLGAWQLVARFENMETEQSQVAANNDEADKFTIGINYYPTQNTRLMLNYDKVTDLTIDGINTSFEPSSLKFRAQTYW